MKKLYLWNYGDDGIVLMAIAESIEQARELILAESLKNVELHKQMNTSFSKALKRIEKLGLYGQHTHPKYTEELAEYREMQNRQASYIHKDNGSFNKDYDYWLTDDKPFIFDLDNPMAYLFANNNP